VRKDTYGHIFEEVVGRNGNINEFEDLPPSPLPNVVPPMAP